MENKQNIQDLIQKFYPYAKETLGFEHPVRVIMRQDAENAQQSMGKTAYYDPTEKLIVLYVTDRHPKDVLRSFSHELVHHAQNCRGELDDLATDGHYAEDGKGREIEKEAYLQGNLNVRDYEDNIKFQESDQMRNIKEQNELGNILDKLYDGPRDKKGIPLEKPPLKKDWKKDPIGRKQRVDFRKWYMEYGPGSKQKDSSDAMGGMTSPEAPATDDTSFDYQTKADKEPPSSEKRRAMSRSEYKRFYGESPETTKKKLDDDDYRKLVGIKGVAKLEKRLKKLDPNAFRKGSGDEFDDSFSTKPFYQSGERGSDYRRDVMKKQNENKGNNKMKLTKGQLKGIIKATVQSVKEGVGEEKKPFPSFAEWFKANRSKYATTSIAQKMYSAKKIAHEKGVHDKSDKKMDEQEALTISPEGSVELPEDVQRLLDMLDSQLQSMEQDDKEMIAKLITRLALEKAMQTASPEVEIEEQEVVTPRSEEEKEEESEEKKSFKMKHPEFSKALDSVRLRPRGEEAAEDEETAVPSGIKVKENNDTWYNSSLYESLKSKWAKKGDK